MLLAGKLSRIRQHRIPRCLVHRVRLRGKMRLVMRMLLIPRERLAPKTLPVRGTNLRRTARLVPTEGLLLTTARLHRIARIDSSIS
jgi:hypothetical protein